MSDTETEHVGPYRLAESLGRGGMGIVHRAIDTRTNGVVAIKLAITDSVQEQTGLRREIYTLSRLSHPGIVRIMDSGIANAVPWYAMTFLQGETLAEHIRRSHHPSHHLTAQTNSTLDPDSLDLSPLAPAPLGDAFLRPGPGPGPVQLSAEALPQRLRIARRLMSTLAYLHAFGVVHRDIKPDNIFLLGDDQPVLVDFGLSHAGATGAARETVADWPLGMGTPGYMSPEVIDGDLPDARADLYAAGCVLFELFSGRPPFSLEHGSLRQILNDHRSQKPPLLSDLVPDLPQALVALVARLLEKDPRQRLSRALDAVDLLERLEAGQDGAEDAGEDSYSPPRDTLQLYRPRLVGRQRALAQLQEDLETLRDGRGGLSVVSGPSGIGKTHLVNEVVRRTARKQAVLPGRCVPVVGPPLLALRPFFERLVDTCASDERLSEALLGDRGPLLLQFSARLQGLPGSARWPVPPTLENHAQRERLLCAVRDTLLAFARHHPTVLLVDDLQWADALTLAVLERLVDSDLSGVALRVVATFRSEERPAALEALLRRPAIVHLTLEPLSEGDVTEMVSDMMGTATPPPRLVALLTAHGGGSPFFVAEYLRAANALALLYRGEDGTLRLDGQAEARLPTTLAPLVARRLEVLSDDARLLVHLASLMGRAFDEGVVSQASSLSPDRLDAAFHELLRQQVVEHTPLGSLQLAHDKIAEIAAEGLSATARAALHLRLAEAITARHAADLQPHHGALAHHCEQAGDVARACHHLEAEAKAAFALLAYERAIQAAERLLLLSGAHLPPERAARWEQMLGESHWSLGDMARCEHHTLRAFSLLGAALPTTMAGWGLRILREAGVQLLHLGGVGVGQERDPDRRAALVRLAQACNTLCWRYLFADKLPHIVALSLLGVNSIERAAPRGVSATAYGWLGFNAGSLRLHRLAERYFARAHADAAQLGRLSDRVFVLLMEGLYKAGFGRMEDELAISHRALAMLADQGDPQSEELHRTMVGNISFYQGNFSASIEHFELVLATARARSNPQHTAWGLYAACWALTARGDFALALPRLEEAQALLDQNADLPSEIITHALLALCRLRLGAPDAALPHILACAERIDRTKIANYPTPHAYGLCADVALQLLDTRPHDAALRALCARLVRDTGRLTWLLPYATCVAWRVKGLLLTRQGRRRRAVDRLRRAADAADALDMRYEAALAWWALAHHHADLAPDAPPEARRRLTDLGCAWHLTQLP